MPERIDTKAVLEGIKAAIAGEGKPSAETLLVWWKALAQERADHLETKLVLGRAAEEIPVAGPVDHRIRILKQEHAKTVAELEARIKELERENTSLRKQVDILRGNWPLMADDAALAAEEKPK